MSLLPSSEEKNLHTLEEELVFRWGFGVVNNPLHPRWCEAKYLPFVAEAFEVDISLLTEGVARALLEVAHHGKTKIGTVGAVKEAIGRFDAAAQLITHGDAPRYNARYKYDGAIPYADYGLTHWAQYVVVLSTPVSLSQKERLIMTLRAVAPARCELVEVLGGNTLIYDGEIKYNGDYTYGGFLNG